MRSRGFVLSFTFARHVDFSLVRLSPLDRMAGTNEELDNEGWSGWPAGTASVWEALVRSQQSGRSSTRSSIRRTRRRNGPLPVGSCSIYRYLAECLRAWVRNQVICRYVLPHRLPHPHPFLRPPSPSAYFPSDCHPRGSRNGTPRYVLCWERSLSPYHIYTHTRIHTYTKDSFSTSYDILQLSSFANRYYA